MSLVSKRYPLSTSDGKYIPLDVVRPSSLITFSLLSATGSTPTILPDETELIKVRSSVDAFFQFFSASTAMTPVVAGTPKDSAIFLPANVDVILSPPVDKAWYSAIGATGPGILYMQILECWNGLTLQSQISRR